MGCIFSSDDDDSQKDSGSDYIKSKYIYGKTLGKGGSCRVVKVTEKANEEQFALKIMSVRAKVNRDLFEKEKKILNLLDHPNIIKFVEAYEDTGSYYVVTQLLSGGELFDRIVNDKYDITEKVASKYVKTMLLATQHCHEKNIVHRDMKPENFVFKTADPESEMVLIDFGCAKEVERKTEYTDLVGTPYYLSPESAAGKRYKRTGEILMSSDLWAIGIITYVLMTGRPPFSGQSNTEIFNNIIKKPLRFPQKVKVSEPFQAFCKSILKKSPKRRIKLEAALKDPWVHGEKSSNSAISKDVIKVLRQFNQQSKLKKAIAKILAEHMGEEPSKKIEAHFKRLDKDNSGGLDADELCLLLMDMGYAEIKAKQEAEAIIKSTDDNKSGFIEFNEFAAVWQRKLLSTNDSYIHKVFSILDTDNNGEIDPMELADVLDMTQEGDDVKIQEIIKEVDKNDDGKINFEEFRNAMTENMLSAGEELMLAFNLTKTKSMKLKRTTKTSINLTSMKLTSMKLRLKLCLTMTSMKMR